MFPSILGGASPPPNFVIASPLVLAIAPFSIELPSTEIESVI